VSDLRRYRLRNRMVCSMQNFVKYDLEMFDVSQFKEGRLSIPKIERDFSVTGGMRKPSTGRGRLPPSLVFFR
jgi:hypothetical protein